MLGIEFLRCVWLWGLPPSGLPLGDGVPGASAACSTPLGPAPALADAGASDVLLGGFRGFS